MTCCSACDRTFLRTKKWAWHWRWAVSSQEAEQWCRSSPPSAPTIDMCLPVTPGMTRYCDWLSNLDIYLAGEMLVVARSPKLVLYSLKASEITHQCNIAYWLQQPQAPQGLPRCHGCAQIKQVVATPVGYRYVAECLIHSHAQSTRAMLWMLKGVQATIVESVPHPVPRRFK